MPKYIAKVTVLEAHDLINADGVSDEKLSSKITNFESACRPQYFYKIFLISIILGISWIHPRKI